jgi:phosphohistidine phosphatase
MDLILWRHAEAEYGPPDLERTLTALGHRQAVAMAAWLKPRLPDDTRVLASPARRALQTAAALTKRVETVDALAPDTSPEAILDACGWSPIGNGCVVVAGHQPTLGRVAGHLLGIPGTLAVRKGAIWWLTGRSREGSPVVLTACLSPSMIIE